MKGNNILGFAQKAGKVVSGHFACEKAIKSGKVSLLLVAEDAGSNTEKYFLSLARENGVRYRKWGKKEGLGKVIGRPPRAVVALLDSRFAAILAEQIGEGDR